MAASFAVRSLCFRTLCRGSANLATRSSVSQLRPSILSDFVPWRTTVRPPPLRLVRRELSSLCPVHSVIASACLISKLPTEASTSSDGRFANYISPI